MKNPHIVIVTGMSGAGKTTAVSIFDDLGYHCVDNFPSELLSDFINILDKEESSAYEKIVLSVNISDFNKFYTNEDLEKLRPFILFLDTNDDELIARYRYNRRIHPNMRKERAHSLEKSIELERYEFNEIRELAHRTIDTTGMNRVALIQAIENSIGTHHRANVKIIVQSFGFRYGIPLDSDYVFDVRFLTNPFYDESLRTLGGDHPKVVESVLNDLKAQRFLDELSPLLKFLVSENLETDKGSMNLSFGCTGGQHRSVVFANHLRDILQEFLVNHPNQRLNEMKVISYHRDLEQNLKDVNERYGDTKND